MGTVDWIFDFLSSTEISEFIWRYYINRFETGWFMPSAHTHKATEIIFVIDGCGYMQFENNIVKINKNNTLIIPSEKPHRYFSDKIDSCTLINIHIDFGAISPDSFSSRIPDPDFPSGLFFNNREYLKLTDSDALESVMKRIVFEMNNRKFSYDILVKLYFCELFTILSRIVENKRHQQNKPVKKYVNQAVKFIEDSLNLDLTIEIISEEVHISQDYLHHIFKEATGVSVMEFVTSQRIQRSKELLKSTNKNVTNIASLVGITNTQYFCTLFKKHTSMTPSQYRRMSQMINNGNSNIFE